MKVRILVALVSVLFAAPASATTIVADFVKAEVAPNSTEVLLPYFMDKDHDVVFLKFKIPNFSQIVSIEAFQIFMALYDDNDGGGEIGDIEFAQPGTNLVLAPFASLNHTDSGAPALFAVSLCPCEILQITPSLQDGNFRLRIARDTGDFIAGAGTAVLDVTFAPEPASSVSMVGGVLILAALRKRQIQSLY